MSIDPLNIKDLDKQFIKAAANNQLDELKILLSQGADIHNDNDNALRWSAWKGHLEVVKFLVLPDLGSVAIAQGGNIHAGDNEPLKWAARFGHLDIVKFLVTKGASIHVNNDEIFKIATRNENEPMLVLLNAFLTEEKLLVAAVGVMPLVAASDGAKKISTL